MRELDAAYYSLLNRRNRIGQRQPIATSLILDIHIMVDCELGKHDIR